MIKNFGGSILRRFLINVFWFSFGLLLLDHITPLEIKDQALRSFAYWGSLISSLILCCFLLKDMKGDFKNLYLLSLISIVLVGFVGMGLSRMTMLASSWKTQEVIYQNSYCPANKVEFQMKDMGALGYKRRRVEVMYWSRFFITCTLVDEDIEQKDYWIKVEQVVNELGLKFP